MQKQTLYIFSLATLLISFIALTSIASAEQSPEWQTSLDFQISTASNMSWKLAPDNSNPKNGDLVWAVPVVEGSDVTEQPLPPTMNPTSTGNPTVTPQKPGLSLLLFVVFASIAVAVLFGVVVSKLHKPKGYFKAVALVGLMVCGVFSALPLTTADQVKTSGYYLSTPTGSWDYQLRNYTDGSIGVVRGSDWANLMTFVGYTGGGALITPPWAGYSLNSTAVWEAIYRNISYGRIESKEVAYPIGNAGIVCPNNTEVTVYYQGNTYQFTGANNTAGSPYTISVGQDMLNGYYLAQDSKDRIIDEWSSTNATQIFTDVITEAATATYLKGSTINVQDGTYPLSTLTIPATTGLTIKGTTWLSPYAVSASNVTGRHGAFLDFSASNSNGIIINGNADSVELKQLGIMGAGRDQGKTGIILNGTYTEQVDMTKITDCLVCNWDTCLWTYYADSLHGMNARLVYARVAANVTYSQSCTFSESYFDNALEYGLYSLQNEACFFTPKNEFVAESTAIGIYSSQDIKCDISDNMFMGADTAIHLNNSNGMMISNNYIRYIDGNCIYLWSSHGNSIIGNQMTAGTGDYCVFLNATSSRNKLIGNEFSSGAYGVYSANAAATNIIDSNSFVAQTTSQVYEAEKGKNTYIANSGFVTETHFFNATNSTATTFTFNHGLAAKPDVVLVEFSSTTSAQYCYNYAVASTGTSVTITVYVETGQTLPAVVGLRSVTCKYIP